MSYLPRTPVVRVRVFLFIVSYGEYTPGFSAVEVSLPFIFPPTVPGPSITTSPCAEDKPFYSPRTPTYRNDQRVVAHSHTQITVSYRVNSYQIYLYITYVSW